MEPSSVNKIFYKRFNLIEKVKESETFGIIVGSLSIENLNDLLDEVKNTLKLKGKKYYQLLLGKITEEKLANFIEYIDCFVLIACPFSDFYNNKSNGIPLVNSLDIKIAFDPKYEWDMSYSFSIDYILSKNKYNNIDKINNNDSNNSKPENEEVINEKLNSIRLLS
jgi:diphthamide biosynthesis protein 2